MCLYFHFSQFTFLGFSETKKFQPTFITLKIISLSHQLELVHLICNHCFSRFIFLLSIKGFYEFHQMCAVSLLAEIIYQKQLKKDISEI